MLFWGCCCDSLEVTFIFLLLPVVYLLLLYSDCEYLYVGQCQPTGPVAPVHNISVTGDFKETITIEKIDSSYNVWLPHISCVWSMLMLLHC